MTEKAFDKAYAISGVDGIPQSTLTRTANRLFKEYEEVFGGGYIPDELKAIAEKIKQAEETELYEYENEYEINGTGDKVYDTVKYMTEARAQAFWDEDDYGDPEYRVTWYFFSSEYYKKRVGTQLLYAGTYHDIYKKSVAAKGKYRYFCVHRPPTNGCIPSGFVSYDTYGRGERYIGEVTYNEKPTDEELNNWGLEFDRDWKNIRRALLDEENKE